MLSADILSLPDASALLRAADAGTPIDMAVRGRLVVRDDGTLETQLVRSKVPGKVQVVRRFRIASPATGELPCPKSLMYRAQPFWSALSISRVRVHPRWPTRSRFLNRSRISVAR